MSTLQTPTVPMRGPAASLYANSPLQLDRRSWWTVAKRVAGATLDMDVSMRCAGVAYFAFLSIFPAIATAILVFSLVTDISFIEGRYQEVIDVLPEQAEELLNAQIIAILSNSGRNLGVGLLISASIALWVGTRGANALVYAISRAHYETTVRGPIASVALSLFVTFGAFLVVLASLFGLAVVPMLTNILPFSEFAELLTLWLRWPVLVAIIFAGVCVLYRRAPKRQKPRWRWVMPGALFATTLWLVASALFSLYVENFADYNATFGALAAPVILVLWFYWSALIFVLGAVMNAELELQTRKDTTTGPSRAIGDRGAYVADNMSEI